METLDEVPAHVWKGLPPGLSLGPSAVDQSRVGESTTPPPWTSGLFYSLKIRLKNRIKMKK